MEHLPPVGWTHLASKDDIALSGAFLRNELTDTRSELRAEIADVRTELKTDINDLRVELKTEMATMRGDLVSQMEKGFKSQTWKTMSAIGVSQTVTVTILGYMLHYMR